MKSLRFPNARLYIHDLLLANGNTGAEAIIEGAREFGIVEQLEGLDDECPISIDCDCCRAVYRVLRQFLKVRGRGNGDLDAAWKALLNRLNKYRLRSAQDSKQAPPQCESHCSNLAPILFDLLLQEVHRYS